MENNVFLVNTATMPIKWVEVRLLNIFVLNVVVTFKKIIFENRIRLFTKDISKQKNKNLYFRFMIKQQYQIDRYIKRIEINNFILKIL